MLKLAIVIGSTRPGRAGEAVVRWAYDLAQKRNDAEFELVDIQEYNLPVTVRRVDRKLPAPTRFPIASSDSRSHPLKRST